MDRQDEEMVRLEELMEEIKLTEKPENFQEDMDDFLDNLDKVNIAKKGD